jgi:hypothetical protein
MRRSNDSRAGACAGLACLPITTMQLQCENLLAEFVCMFSDRCTLQDHACLCLQIVHVYIGRKVEREREREFKTGIQFPTYKIDIQNNYYYLEYIN